MTSMAGNILGTVAKTTATMVTAATGAVAALTKVSVAQYAEYEQLVGGVETLFKDSRHCRSWDWYFYSILY